MKLFASAALFLALAASPVFAQAVAKPTPAVQAKPALKVSEAAPDAKPVATPLPDADKVVILTVQRDQTAALLALQKTQEYQAFLQAQRKLEVDGSNIAKKNGCTKGIDAELNCLK